MGNGMGSFLTEFRYRTSETGQMDGGLIKIDFA
jgi:3D-(3,5/4)-trihydroxycyclohexane-1,2-dione acylhydrolase (decyclizing)